MPAALDGKQVKDMTSEELKSLIREAIYETIDPDYGLALRPEFEESLKTTAGQKEKGEGVSLEDVKKRLGLA
jgi:hypothetical protein